MKVDKMVGVRVFAKDFLWVGSKVSRKVDGLVSSTAIAMAKPLVGKMAVWKVATKAVEKAELKAFAMVYVMVEAKASQTVDQMAAKMAVGMAVTLV